jgi:hypothetical protein
MPQRAHTAQRVSLFPFLSVLVCLIGVLMFLAAGLALSSIGSATSNVDLEIPKESRHGKKPIILQCTTNVAHSLDGQLSFPLDQERIALESGECGGGTPFTDFLGGIASRGTNEYVLFLVKPDGLEAFLLLREIIQKRNGSLSGCSSRRMAEQPKPIPRELAARGAGFSNARLHFAGRMTRPERDSLRALFSDPDSLSAVDELFEKTQSLPAPLDYGSELLPAHWQVPAAAGTRAADEGAAGRGARR